MQRNMENLSCTFFGKFLNFKDAQFLSLPVDDDDKHGPNNCQCSRRAFRANCEQCCKSDQVRARAQRVAAAWRGTHM